jgi:two-component system sensor histidine kinase YesM
VETLVEASERISGGERGYTITEEAHSREFESLYEHFNAMSLELKDQFERSYQEQQALQQARIKALQLQINPHFLNNTLEIINWEARLAGDDRVSAMIEALSVMMDGALGRDGRSRISLREELSYVDAYLYIIRERLGERLEVVKEIEEEMLEVPVPRLILQPLAENAVEHDITPNRGGKLCIRACREGGRAALEVEHSGRLSEEDRKAAEAMLSSDVSDTEISGQIGLRNVRQRLKLLYGEEGSLSLSEPGPDRILARAVFPAES